MEQNPAYMAAKTSVLTFYLHLSKNTDKFLRIASYVTLAVVNIGGLVLTFLNIFQCRPFGAVFEVNPPATAQCVNIVTLYLAAAPVNVITDLAILCLPIPILTGMRMAHKQKTLLVLPFALGIFVTVVDIVRIYFIQQTGDATGIAEYTNGRTIKPQFDKDFPYHASLTIMWSAVEINVGITCACIPALKPLVTLLLPNIMRDDGDSRGSASTQSTKTEPADSHASAGSSGPLHDRLPISSDDGLIESHSSRQMGLEEFSSASKMDFVTMLGMDEITQTQSHITPHKSETENAVYFGFVNLSRPKSMMATGMKESVKYCSMVTILFFLWGFSYGLLEVLNYQISLVGGMSSARMQGLGTVYFGAYGIGPLVLGRPVLKAFGFRMTFIAGLALYAIGVLMFWPSAVLISWPGFIVSYLTIGMSLSVLETAANPFLALCGPLQYAEIRLLLAQGVQGIGSVVSHVLAQKVFYNNVEDVTSLVAVQWTYLAIALLSVVLALFFYYMPLPEASDEDFEAQTARLEANASLTSNTSHPTLKIFKHKYPLAAVTLILAVAAQFTYVSAQEAASMSFSNLLNVLTTYTASPLTLLPHSYGIVSRAAFALGRFIAAFILILTPAKPRMILLVSFLGSLIFCALAMGLRTPDAIAACMVVGVFFQGPIWPTLFALTLRGQGKHTKTAAALLTATVSGGAVFPWVTYAVDKLGGDKVQASLWVVVALFITGTIYPLYLNLVPAVRRSVRTGRMSVWDKWQWRSRSNKEG